MELGFLDESIVATTLEVRRFFVMMDLTTEQVGTLVAVSRLFGRPALKLDRSEVIYEPASSEILSMSGG